jgi:type I restriction enzyme S subunit
VRNAKWKQVPIESVYHGLYDGPHATPKISDKGPIFLGIKNITEDGHFDLTTIRHISESEFPRWTRRVEPQPDDIVFTYEATLNRYAIIPKGFRGCLGRRLALIRPDKSKVDPKFLLLYFFGRDWRDMIATNITTGSTVDRIPLLEFPRFQISLPPLPTQRKIASILSAYDDLIENNTRRIAILEEMAQAIYREWFVNFRFPGHENVKLVDSPRGKIPEGWEASTLGNCAQVIPGYAFKSKDWQESGVPVVKIKNITDDNFVEMESADCVSESLISETMRKFMLETGDLVLAMTGATAGKAGVVRIRGLCALNQRVAKISPNDGFRSLLWCFLMSNRKLFFSLADGAAQPNMSGGQIESVPVLVPLENVLRIFESRVSDIAQLADKLYFKNRNLRSTRDLLLPKLISGQLDVEDLDIYLGATTEELQETAR